MPTEFNKGQEALRGGWARLVTRSTSGERGFVGKNSPLKLCPLCRDLIWQSDHGLHGRLRRCVRARIDSLAAKDHEEDGESRCTSKVGHGGTTHVLETRMVW